MKQDVRKLWIEAGGKFHGPNVEHGYMPESLLLPFLEGLIVPAQGQPKGDSEIDRLGHEIDRLRSGYGLIMTGLTNGTVSGEDIVWFDTITTLYDFCGDMLGHTFASTGRCSPATEGGGK